ncbi:MAG: alpha-amylase family protein, partial [Candidatus Hydrogenedentes bacterium]|nr:alpha-amylase family protein [Candidatus Hydrogenedentota bacterium]
DSVETGIPKLAAGKYFVGLESFNGEQFTGWRFETITITAPWAIAEVELATRHVSPDGTVEATVRVADVPPEGSRFVFDVLDNCGRSVHREIREATRETAFLGRVNESLHLYNYANVKLLDADGALLSEMRQGFYVAQPNAPTDDISVMVWEACAAFDPFLRQMLRRFAELGANAALIGGYKGTVDTTYAQACAMSNVHPILYVTRLTGPQVSENGIRQPTVTSEGYKNTLKATLKKQAEAFKPFSPFAYSLGDDQTYVYPSQDVGWSESYRAILAKWAERQFSTIEALNEAWGTSYTTFAEVEPIRRTEAFESALADPPDFSGLCHWVDHQLCQDEMLAAWHREMADVVEAADANTVCWYDCTIQGWPQPGAAFDFWELGRQSRFAVQYLNPIVHDILRTVVAKDAYHGTWYGGYGLYNYYPYTDAGFLPWWAVFRGVNLHGLYYGGNSPSYFEERLLCPDLGPTVTFDKILDNLSELRSGTAKLLFNAEKQHDCIAVLYSSPSLHHVALFQDPLPKAHEWEGQATAADEFLYMQEWEGLTLLLRDLGYDFNVVSWKALEDSSFLDMGYRVLALPLTLRLSESQAEAIRQFVEGGGVIITDVFTGTFDGRSRLSDGGMLADVLGVRLAPALPGDRLVMDSAELLDGPPLGEMAVDMNVMAKTAQARAFTASGAPLMFVHKFGEGHTILLNTLVRDYQIWRTLGSEMPFRDAVGALLNESAGSTPFVEIQVEVRGKDTPSHRIQAAEVNRYKLGDGEYVGILRHPKLRPDDSIWMADQRPKPAWVTLPHEAHVYDMRRGMYRGFTNRFEDVFYPGRAELYALLPYEVVDIAIQVGRDGEAFAVSGVVEVAAAGDVKPTHHVVHLRVRDPQGHDHSELARNVLAKNGRFNERFFLGYNASGGSWTVSARDAAAGIEKTVVLPVNAE